MKPSKSITRLAKYLEYILGRRPDEIGLIPDHEGYVKIKALLKGLSEEGGWRHVRKAHLNELQLVLSNTPIEIRENDIRAKQREMLPVEEIDFDPPKLLFTCIRQRAYPHVHEKGLLPGAKRPVILSADRQMAIRMGRRIDPDPVLLTVHVGMAQERGGLLFRRFGSSLYLTDEIPAGFFTGPPLPKEKRVEQKAGKKPDAMERPEPGSFRLDPTPGWGRGPESPPSSGRSGKSNRKGGGKKSRKPRKERPPWRS